MNVGTALQHLLTLGVLGFLISASISHHWIVLDQLSDESTRVGLWKICVSSPTAVTPSLRHVPLALFRRPGLPPLTAPFHAR